MKRFLILALLFACNRVPEPTPEPEPPKTIIKIDVPQDFSVDVQSVWSTIQNIQVVDGGQYSLFMGAGYGPGNERNEICFLYFRKGNLVFHPTDWNIVGPVEDRPVYLPARVLSDMGNTGKTRILAGTFNLEPGFYTLVVRHGESIQELIPDKVKGEFGPLERIEIMRLTLEK